MVAMSCKWDAKINDDFVLERRMIVAATIALPDTCSVPRHTSSPITRVFGPVLPKIVSNSVISRVNDDWPLKILSLPVILANKESYGENSNCIAGTYNPH